MDEDFTSKDIIEEEPYWETTNNSQASHCIKLEYPSSAPINIPFNRQQQQAVPPTWYMSPPSINPQQLHAESLYNSPLLSPSSMSPTSPADFTNHLSGAFSPAQHYEGTYTCVCGKRYASLTALRNHAKLHTIRERNFICTTCRKAFLRKQDLKRHETTHLEDYHPYSCDHCSTTFTRSDALSRHIKARRCMDSRLSLG